MLRPVGVHELNNGRGSVEGIYKVVDKRLIAGMTPWRWVNIVSFATGVGM